MIGFYRSSKVVFDFAQRVIEFENSLPPKGFWNLIPQKFVRCEFGDITDVDAYAQNGYLCLQVKTVSGNRVFLNDTVPRFQEFVADFQSVLNSTKSC